MGVDVDSAADVRIRILIVVATRRIVRMPVHVRIRASSFGPAIPLTVDKLLGESVAVRVHPSPFAESEFPVTGDGFRCRNCFGCEVVPRIEAQGAGQIYPSCHGYTTGMPKRGSTRHRAILPVKDLRITL